MENENTLQDVKARFLQAFSLYIFIKEASPLIKGKINDGYYAILNNSAIESTLMSLRDSDDFFSPANKRQSSDLRASDYSGYTTLGSFLNLAERGFINKHLTHLTSNPALHRESESLTELNITNMVERMTNRSFHFFQWVSTESDASLDIKDTISQTLETMKSLKRNHDLNNLIVKG